MPEMTKYTMFKIIQIVNVGDIMSTYAFYRLSPETFDDVSPFFLLMSGNIYAFLFLKYIVLVILSIGIYKIFSEKYFTTFYLIVYSLYAFAIAHNVMAYQHLSANILGTK